MKREPTEDFLYIPSENRCDHSSTLALTSEMSMQHLISCYPDSSKHQQAVQDSQRPQLDQSLSPALLWALYRNAAQAHPQLYAHLIFLLALFQGSWYSRIFFKIIPKQKFLKSTTLPFN